MSFDSDESESDARLIEQVRNIRRNTISGSSANIYKSSTISFIMYLKEKKPELLSSTVRARVAPLSGTPLRACLSELLGDLDNLDEPPIQFERLIRPCCRSSSYRRKMRARC
jgi:hypothetical protein